MKNLGLILAILLVVAGCAHVQHSETLQVDHFGATGTYQDSRAGSLYEMGLAAGGAGGGTAAGAFAFYLRSNQAQSDPRPYAKSIVMVDLSKKLKSIKVDDIEGIREYEYIQPLVKSEIKPMGPGSMGLGSKTPSSFGYQPVQ